MIERLNINLRHPYACVHPLKYVCDRIHVRTHMQYTHVIEKNRKRKKIAD